MGCCGEKRRKWKNSDTKPEPQKQKHTQPSFKPNRVFQYIGNTSLTISGIATENTYRFAFKGDKQEVCYTDSFALMAENELILIAT